MPQRTDLSPYLVHLTRDYDGHSARDNLLSMLALPIIEARNAYGIAVRHLEAKGWTEPAFAATQRVVCFSETPIENLPALLAPGVYRKYLFQPYGLVFPRQYLIRQGVNPVWYLNQFSAPGVTFDWKVNDVNAMIDEAVLGGDGKPDGGRFSRSRIARLTPLIEAVGIWPSSGGGKKAKDFSFEREWRLIGSVAYSRSELHGVIIPTGLTGDFSADLVKRGMDRSVVDRLRFIELSAPS